MTLNSSLIFYGAKDSGKSTFLFQTSFFNMLTDQLFGSNNQNEGLSRLNGAWIQAYEIGIDQRTRVEKKTNLLLFDDNVDLPKSNNANISKRGQMVHKAVPRNMEKETFVELELTEDGNRIQPEQLMFLLQLIKQNSLNFEKSLQSDQYMPRNNQAHLFIKLHFWHENLQTSSLTIVDMAGYPHKTKQQQGFPKNHVSAYQEKYSELNS